MCVYTHTHTHTHFLVEDIKKPCVSQFGGEGITLYTQPFSECKYQHHFCKPLRTQGWFLSLPLLCAQLLYKPSIFVGHRPCTGCEQDPWDSGSPRTHYVKGGNGCKDQVKPLHLFDSPTQASHLQSLWAAVRTTAQASFKTQINKAWNIFQLANHRPVKPKTWILYANQGSPALPVIPSGFPSPPQKTGILVPKVLPPHNTLKGEMLTLNVPSFSL